MSRTPVFVALLLASVALALAFRLPQLNLRPMHGDEAVHAYKCNELWQSGLYVYDPEEYHGPTLYYGTLPVFWLSSVKGWAQTSAAAYRIVPVFFGVGLILLLFLVADGLGRPATICAAVLTALSSPMVFYSRYYIQETLLVFFTFLVMAAGWRFTRAGRMSGQWSWAVLLGAGIGLMHATKETCVIAWACLALALAIVVLWSHTAPRRALVGVIAIALPAAVLTSLLLFAGLSSHLGGAVDSVRGYATYFRRAAGVTHYHPWYYYLQILGFVHYASGPTWSEALIVVLGAVGAFVALRGRAPTGVDLNLVRFLAVYTLLMLCVYSVIPYKTPWCVLGFLHGLILLAGVGGGWLLHVVRVRAAQVCVGVVLLAAAGQLGWQAWRGSHDYVFCADPRNPCVYAHPVRDVEALEVDVERLAAASPLGHGLLIRVVIENCWPLPWYLRRFGRVGYYEHIPDDADVDVVLASTKLESELEHRLHHDYEVTYRGLRRDEVLAVYVRRDLWDAFRARQTRAGTTATSP
jgi:uncharacterized protein (TIGR03663 family)